MVSDGKIFVSLALHLALIGIPAVAAALVAVRQRVENVPLIIGIALAASGIAAFASFWAYYMGTTVGQVWDFLLLFGAVEVGLWAAWKGNLNRDVLRALAVPLALWILGSYFIAYLGFVHGGFDAAVPMSSTRFSDQLPSDNDIPRFFSEWFAQQGGKSPPPVYPPDWLMSDRPPLQIGYVLSNQAVIDSTTSSQYELLAIGVQQLWVPAMWAVLTAARLRPGTRALAMLAAMVSDVAILHGFFVWPKLIAATFVLAALALLISPQWERWRRDWRLAVLFALLLVLAMLSHGSSVFAVIPMVLLAIYRGLPSWRWAAVLVLVGAVVYAPWVAYQKYENPPGNRLLKYQLAGAIEVENRGTVEAIVDSYEATGVEGTIEYKLDNYEEMIGAEHVVEKSIDYPPSVPILAGNPTWADAVEALGEGDMSGVISGFRGPRFTSLLPFLGLLLIAPFAMFVARAKGRHEQSEWRFSLLCFAFVGIACFFWGLLLFGTSDARTTLHVGSLAVPLLALIACVVGLRSAFPRLATALVGLNLLVVLVTYVPSVRPWPGTSYSPLAALLMALSLAGICWVLREAWPRRVGSSPG